MPASTIGTPVWPVRHESISAGSFRQAMSSYARLAARKAPGIGLATVYRSLKALIEAGDVAVVTLPGDTPRYELAHLHHHHHFHCRACGGVFEVEGCPGDLAALAPSGFAVDGHEVVLYGRCARCAS